MGGWAGSSQEHGGGEAPTRRPGQQRRRWLAKEKIQDGFMGSFWGPVQILLGTDEGDLETLGPRKQRDNQGTR